MDSKLNEIKKDTRLRYLLTKPFTKRLKEFTATHSLSKALNVLEQSLNYDRQFQEILPEIESELHKQKKLNLSNPESLKQKLGKAKILFLARRMEEEQYFFYCLMLVERFFDDQWSSNKYKESVQPLEQQMAKIRSNYQLREDEDWNINEGPKEYKQLQKEYDDLYNHYFINTLREFDLNEMADLKYNNPQKFDELRERGRRSIFHKDCKKEALHELVLNYEKEALSAAESKAFLSAIILLAAALEELLILRCYKSPKKAREVYNKVGEKFKSRRDSKNDPSTWKFDCLIEVCFQAHWFKKIYRDEMELRPEKIAHHIRIMRNYIHPAKHIKDSPWRSTTQQDFEHVKSLYIFLLFSLKKSINIK
ncbi:MULTISPECIES: hypothetical protein [Legionella]|uniref:hypothetical protein n=1 Tax=Legionella TaxID=445 RepID=UPI000F8C355A|nr:MULTISPECIES: hypothetical protein [Legionella]MCP0912903.1 hypothetical protein [Legionella sp. 27cVA30]RUR10059.1 hypothetical protein ELY14_06750 [Legionella septentrionalis]